MSIGHQSPSVGSRSAGFTISCSDCVMQHTDACADCLVTYVCERDPGDALVVEVDELRTMRLLSDAGLVPRLRHTRRRR